jgi:hypothetical protein
MKQHQKRWLISRLKTSGSKRNYLDNGTYAETRSSKPDFPFEELPSKEGIQHTSSFYNGKINYGLLVRFLRGQVGNDWDEVQTEILARIPTRLMQHKDMLYWYVADKVECTADGRIWNKRTQRFIGTGRRRESHTEESTEFYVHPQTNRLTRSRSRQDRPTP